MTRGRYEKPSIQPRWMGRWGRVELHRQHGKGCSNNCLTVGASGSASSNSASANSASTGFNLDKSRDKAQSQILAAWLNFAKGSLDWNELVDTTGNGTPNTTFGALITEVELIMNDPGATKADLDRAKRLAEAANKHDKDNPDCDTGTASRSGTGAGSKASGSGSGGDQKK
jgi:hypothetical protein